MSRIAIILLLIVQVFRSVALATTYAIASSFAGTDCSGTPYTVIATIAGEASDCVEETCSESIGETGEVTVDMYSIECVSDYISAMREKFVDGSPYILFANFQYESCETFNIAYEYPALRNCEGSYYQNSSNYVIGRLEDNGSATLDFYDEDKCLSTSWNSTQTVDEKTLDSHACDSTGTKWYSSKDDQDLSTSGSTSEDSSSGLSTGTIIETICGCVAVLLVVAIVLFFYLRRSKGKYAGQLTTTLLSGDMTSLQAEMEGQKGLWNDDIITAKRIPRDKVKIKKLLSRGAFGEVYSGIFNGQLVAIKMLIPATRSSIQHVNDFLAEAKMTATMEHPHIVIFVAVAWDSLSDLCVILEFMDNGDL